MKEAGRLAPPRACSGYLRAGSACRVTFYQQLSCPPYSHVAELTRGGRVGVQNMPRSRAALSLLGYSYYQVNNFAEAATMYQELVHLCPEVEEYKIYHAQSLYKVRTVRSVAPPPNALHLGARSRIAP